MEAIAGAGVTREHAPTQGLHRRDPGFASSRSRSGKRIQPTRRRPGPSAVFAIAVCGALLIVHTFWVDVQEGKSTQVEQGLVQEFDQILFRSGTSDASTSSAHETSPDPEKLRNTNKPVGPQLSSRSKIAIPIVDSISTGDQVLKDRGGASITIHGRNFGDEEAEVFVKIGSTFSPRTDWISDEILVARSPMGVGADLDVTVWVSEPALTPVSGTGRAMFSYSRPFVYDVIPFRVGSPLEGPFNVTIKAWGLGYFDSHPEAQLNGQKCAKTIWVDNSSVICTIPDHVRLSLANPEIKVAGQRSMCGILAPGVCTVSVGHSSISSPARIREEIRAIKARGGDWKAAMRRFQEGERIGGLGEKNTPDNPCTNIGNCTPATLVFSLSSAVMMMMGMGSICLVLVVARPFSQWIAKDWKRAREESSRGEYDDVLDAEEARQLSDVAQQEDGEAGEEEEMDEEEKRQLFDLNVRVF